MKRFLSTMGAVAWLAFPSFAVAGSETFDLGGQTYRFDIPPGFERDKEFWKDDFKAFKAKNSTNSIVFTVSGASVEKEINRLTALDKKTNAEQTNIKSETEAVYSGRVGRHVAIYENKSEFILGSVFADACSDRCLVKVQVMVGARDGKPKKPAEGRALLDKYAKYLADRGFEATARP